MPRRAGRRRTTGKNGRSRARRSRLAIFWPTVRLRRRCWRAVRRLSPFVQAILGLAATAAVLLAINWALQAIRKPSELFFPVSGTLYKTPSETWQQYSPLFRKYATTTISPDLLAAIAQVEGSGNPVVRTYWRWSWTSQPTDVYRPASSAVGMYQITDGTFSEARRYCVRNHTVVEDGPWNNWRTCWFNSLYTRVVPAHAIELTSAYLDHRIAIILERRGLASATLQHRQELAAVIHLCGAGAGDDYVARGFRLLDAQRCGDHDAREYIDRVIAMRGVFARLAARAAQSPF